MSRSVGQEEDKNGNIVKALAAFIRRWFIILLRGKSKSSEI